jgi:hypothetical protein
MATHDYNLANQSGADFRADLNNALSAILSNNASATEPTTTTAYMLWVDTANSLLKMRNAADNAWITLPVSITTSNTVDIDGGTVNTITSLSFSSGETVTTILDEDDLSSDDASALATQQSIKAYVDSQVTAQDLDFQGDTGGALSIDLDSETFTISGGNGIDTSGALNTLTIAIDSSVVTLTDTQTLTNKSIDADSNTISNLEVDNLKSGVLDTDLTSVSASDDTLASSKAIKTYVDAQVTAQDLDLTDGTTSISIDLDSETLSVLGGTGVTSTASGNGVTLAIGQDVGTTADVTFNTVAADLTGDVTGTVSSIANHSTSDLSEGTNLYYTTARFDSAFSGKSTSDLTEGTNLYFTDERVDDRVNNLLVAGSNVTLTYDDVANTLTIAATEDNLSNNDTDDLAEGSANLYFTDARARAAISVSGDLSYNSTTGVISFTERTDAEVRGLVSASGDLSYNSTTGVFSFTERTDAEVRGLISGGTGVTYNNSTGVISIGQAVGTSDNVTFGDVIVSGDLTVSGTTTTVNTETINLADNIILFNSNATGTPTENAGIEIERGDATNKTLLWNETDDKWTVGSETFVAGTFEGALTGNVTGTVSSLANHDTDDLSEGATNLYYADSLVDSHLSGGTGVTYSSGTISIGQSVGTGDSVTFAGVSSDFTGDIDGAVKFTAKADVALTKGQVVYISGISGSVPTVNLADADNASAMPAFGLVYANANANAEVEIITFGSLADFNTSGFSVGDTVYVSTTAGSLTATPPTGESSLIQNIGIVQRSHASAGIIKVGGAGRTNATPNLNSGKIFYGNGSNQSVATTLDTSIVPENTNLYYTDARARSAISVSGNALSYNSSTGVITSNYEESPTFTGTVTVTGEIVANGGVALGDSDKATFGDSDDLQIYHSGSHSYIDDAGTGNLYIRAADSLYLQKYTGETFLQATADGEVRITHNNNTKLATTSTGIDVTGTITCDDSVAIENSSGYGRIEVGGSTGAYIDLKSPNSDDYDGRLITTGADLTITSHGGVNLQYGNSDRLTTNFNGIDVTGTVVADGLTVDGTSILDSETNFVANSTASNKSLVLASSGATGGTGQYGASLAFSRINTESPRAAIAAVNTDSNFERMGLSFWTHPTNTVGNMLERLRIDHQGDISFYEDTGTTAKLFWDASAEGLNIGATNAPNGKLDVSDVGGSGYATIFDTGANGDNYYTAGTSGVQIFRNGSSERMRIDSSGNVGIGTASPVTKFHVSGSNTPARFSDDGTGFNLDIIHDTATGITSLKQTNSGGDLRLQGGSATGLLLFETAGTEAMRINSSGNVGIGTSSPNYTLQVHEPSDSTVRFQITNSNTGSGTADGFQIIQNGSSQSNKVNLLNYENSALGIWTNNAERLHITASGNVGIGTTSPARPLDVNGSARLLDSSNLEWGGTSANIAGSSSTDTLFFRTASTERMRIDSSGNVGINQTSPTQKLEVVGKIVATEGITTFAGDPTNYGLFRSGTTMELKGAATFNIKSGSGSPLIFYTNDTSERMRIHSNGAVSIGTSTGIGTLGIVQHAASATTFALYDSSSNRKWFYLPNAYYGYQGSETIHSNGGVNRYFANTSGTAVGSIVVNSGSTAFNTTSDYRLKDNQQPLTGSGEFIDALQPKTWTWNHGDGGTGVGFIAHEVAEVGLGLCVSGEKDGVRLDRVLNEQTGEYEEQEVPKYQQVDYSNGELIANMVAELQSLRARVAELENA